MLRLKMSLRWDPITTILQIRPLGDQITRLFPHVDRQIMSLELLNSKILTAFPSRMESEYFHFPSRENEKSFGRVSLLCVAFNMAATSTTVSFFLSWLRDDTECVALTWTNQIQISLTYLTTRRQEPLPRLHPLIFFFPFTCVRRWSPDSCSHPAAVMNLLHWLVERSGCKDP